MLLIVFCGEGWETHSGFQGTVGSLWIRRIKSMACCR